MRWRYWLALGAMCSACGISGAAKRVRMYSSEDQVVSCQNLGFVNGTARLAAMFPDESARKDLREAAVDLGADAIVVVESGSKKGPYRIKAAAYSCKGNNAAASASAARTAPATSPSITKVQLSQPESILVLDIQMLDGEKRVGQILASMISAELEKVAKLSVIGSRDIEAVLDVEKQRDYIGCDSVSCLAEIAGAMGTSLVLHGTVGSIGTKYSVNASVFDSRLGKSRARASRIVERNEDALIAVVSDLSATLAFGVAAAK